MGSTDGTTDLHPTIHVDDKNYSKIRNDIIGNSDWQMWIEPWEILTSGADQILYAIRQQEPAYNVYTLQGNILSKSTRLWRKSSGIHFERPVYESLEPDIERPLIQAVISGTGSRDQTEIMSLLNLWESTNPHAADVEYYKACTYLIHGRYDQFLTHANNYLFRANKVSTSSILTNYYISLIMLHHKNNPSKCIQHITHCISCYPTLAEFWCLLGDAFAKMGQWHRASGFYDNAIVLGSRRKHDDQFPIEISKYKEYPDKMLERCREAIKQMHGIKS